MAPHKMFRQRTIGDGAQGQDAASGIGIDTGIGGTISKVRSYRRKRSYGDENTEPERRYGGHPGARSGQGDSGYGPNVPGRDPSRGAHVPTGAGRWLTAPQGQIGPLGRASFQPYHVEGFTWVSPPSIW